MNYWYEKEPDLLEAEVALMQKYFPSFKFQISFHCGFYN